MACRLLVGRKEPKLLAQYISGSLELLNGSWSLEIWHPLQRKCETAGCMFASPDWGNMKNESRQALLSGWTQQC